MPRDFEQHLSHEFISLYFDHEDYKGLRKLLQSDNELVFAVRKNQIHIYYLGGRILKITLSDGKLKFEFNGNYAKKRRGSSELNEYGEIVKQLTDKANRYNVDMWTNHFDVLKRCMFLFRQNVVHDYERQLQQRIELANRDFKENVIVVDNEYGVRVKRENSSKLCKFDLVTLYKDDEKYKICLVELKLGDGAISKKSGIMDHIADFDVIIDARKNDIIASINNLVEYKKLNNYLYNVPDDFHLSDDTEICASILCYDLDDKVKALREIEKGKNSRQVRSYKLYSNINLNSACPKLDVKDILGK